MSKHYFGISRPHMAEIAKMYWYLPVASFVLYFFTGIFPILINMRNLDVMENYVSNLMGNWSLSYICLLTFVPLIAAVLMMTFLHSEAKSMTLHSQPISRYRLFNTRYLSGWLMCVAPVVVTALITMIMCLTMDITYQYGALSGGAVLGWMFNSMAIITFLYSMYVMAGSLTGTTAIHILTSGVLFVCIPLVIVIALQYCETFFRGWSGTPQWIESLTGDINPIIRLLFTYEEIEPRAGVLYLLLGLFMMLLAKHIYATRKLERVGSSTLSKAFEEIMTYLLAFVGMATFGLIASSFTQSKLFTVLGMALGLFMTFALTKIVLKRAIRCWDKSMIKSLVICLAVGTVFTAITVFDVTAYDKKVPPMADIESVEMSNMVSGYGPMGYFDEEDESLGEFFNDNLTFTSEESIALVRELHQYILEEKLYDLPDDIYENDSYGVTLLSGDGSETLIQSEIICIRYNLKNGQRAERYYSVLLTEGLADKIDEILTCKEYKEKMTLSSALRLNRLARIHVEGYTEEYFMDYGESLGSGEDEMSSTMVVIDDPKLMKGLMDAKDKDIATYSYLKNNPMYNNTVLAGMYIYMDTDSAKKNDSVGASSSGASSKSEDTARLQDGVLVDNSSNDANNEYGHEYDEAQSIFISVLAGDQNTIRFLAENGMGSLVGE